VQKKTQRGEGEKENLAAREKKNGRWENSAQWGSTDGSRERVCIANPKKSPALGAAKGGPGRGGTGPGTVPRVGFMMLPPKKHIKKKKIAGGLDPGGKGQIFRETQPASRGVMSHSKAQHIKTGRDLLSSNEVL